MFSDTGLSDGYSFTECDEELVGLCHIGMMLHLPGPLFSRACSGYSDMSSGVI